MSSRCLALLPPALAILAVCARAGSVLVVDAAAGPYFDIQPAVDAAAGGDVVLVRSGDYTTFAVASRSVAVVADTGAFVRVQGAVRVRNLDAGETCVFAGLHATGNQVETFDRYGFSGLACAGSIRVQDCEFRGADGQQCELPPDSGFPAGARFESCADVAMSSCQSIGGAARSFVWRDSLPTGRGGAGVDAQSSRVALDRVDALGPHGASGCCDGGSGGHGLALRGTAEVFLSACTLQGGNGGNGNCPSYGLGGSGGYGLLQISPCPDAVIARTLASSLSGGALGTGSCSIFCDPHDFDGGPGYPAIVFACSTYAVLAGSPPSLTSPSVVRESTAVTLHFQGSPGDRLSIRIARATAHAWDPSRNGVLLVQSDESTSWHDVGLVPPSGQLGAPMAFPALPAGDQARIVHLQVRAERVDGTQQLGSARSMVIVGTGF